MKYIYEIIFVDEYDNFNQLGWFENLDDSIEQINGCLELYGNGQYKLEKGDLKAYPSTFGMCFDIGLANFFSDKLDEEDEDEICSDLQSTAIRGFVLEVEDEEFNLYKKLLIESPKDLDLTNEKFSIDKLFELIEKGENMAILKAYKKDPLKIANDIMNSIIESTMKTLAENMQIDINKYNIDKDKIKDNDYWKLIEEDYDIENGKIFQRVKNEDLMKCFNSEEDIQELNHDFNFYEEEKSKYDFLGYYIFNLEMVEYYIYNEKLYTYLYTFYNDEKYLSQILIAERKNQVH